MKTERNILIAFLLNLLLAIVGVVGGLISGSFAVISDSIHSLGDSVTIAISFVLERKSKLGADKKHTFGYARYSLLGALITNMFMIVASAVVILEAIEQLGEEPELATSEMLYLAIFGAVANFIAALVTHGHHSHNEHAVSLHAIQDTMSWLAIIAGAAIIHATGFVQIDAILSIMISLVIICKVILEFRKNLYILLDNTPPEVDYDALVADIKQLDDIKSIHHLHIWSLDGENNCASIHCEANTLDKDALRKIFRKHKVNHVTIELDDKVCSDKDCKIHAKTRL